MPGIAVVHLVRAGNDPALLERFVRSYREHPAGVAHELVVLLKGMRPGATGEADRALGDLPHRREFIADTGFDLHAYFDAARKLDYDYFCFLNSSSRVLGDDWLAKLHRCVSQPGVGLAGATGSWQSVVGNYLGQDGAGGPPSTWAKIRNALLDRRPGMLKRRAWAVVHRLRGAL